MASFDPQSGTLQTLKVKELDKCVTNPKLPTVGRKDDNMKRITADYYIRSNTNSISLHTRTDETGIIILNETVNR